MLYNFDYPKFKLNWAIQTYFFIQSNKEKSGNANPIPNLKLLMLE